jgi:cold shock CspA family protein
MGSKRRCYGFIRVDHTQKEVWVSEQDAPNGSLSEGDRCEFRIVEYKNQKNRKLEGTRLQWKAVDVVCVQRAAAVPVPPQPSC